MKDFLNLIHVKNWRLIIFSGILSKIGGKMPKNFNKVNMISTWKVKCGIADSSRLLTDGLNKYEDIIVDIHPIKETNTKNPLYFFNLIKNINKHEITHIQYQPTLFGNFPLPFTGLNYFPLIISFLKFWKRNKLVSTVHEIGLKDYSISDWIAIKFLNLSDKLIVHSPELIELLEEKGINKDKIIQIPLGESKVKILNKKECKEKLGVSHKNIITIFGFVGKLKGHDLAIDILPYLKKNFILLIAGGARIEEHEVYLNFLRKKVNEMKLEDRVKFLGYIKEEDLPFIACATDIFLFPYRWITASMALNFALSYETPTITSDLNYFKGIKNKYDCIELFKRDDKDDLLEKLEEIINNKKKQYHLKNKCSEFNKKNSLQVASEITRDLYLNL